jgi:ribokinase
MNIGVLGSINMDIVYQVQTAPMKGQTVFGSTYDVLPGGKGANQAVMMSALGINVSFLGAVGPDGFGQMALDAFVDKGIAPTNVVHAKEPTGIAVIELTQNDNSIVVIPGANLSISNTHVDEFFQTHQTLDGVVAQLETNLDSVESFLRQAHQKQIPTILNPAPAQPITPEWMEFVDILIPNEHEAAVIFGNMELTTLVARYPLRMIVTLGDQGAMYHDGQQVVRVPAQQVTVVDTTGAGDSFVAGFAKEYLLTKDFHTAIQHGIAIASITCEHLGAQGAFHTVKEKYQ